jgi:hypothetical protein
MELRACHLSRRFTRISCGFGFACTVLLVISDRRNSAVRWHAKCCRKAISERMAKCSQAGFDRRNLAFWPVK